MAEITTIARPYAQAVFDTAKEQGKLKDWSEMLQLAAAVVSHPEVAAVVDSPSLDKAQRGQLIIDICGDKLDDGGKNLLRVLAENGRLSLLPEIAALYEVERAAAESRITAEVTSATPLSDSQKQAIAAALKKRLGRDVALECKVDEALLGGAVVRAGDMVIDGSVTGKLNKLSAALLR
ncbi:F0F1 ATP synthase subunit delta [Sulfurivermis fontis]|uniref:F0F1 ATP synthase subunit delta n=1 Tax=Sulfurivermis fontis TaxID=1972068 RepID=UPI000FD846D0|nr:F0F1 ATP synthase subunit delta [Sulfurivermis fontis]